MKLWEASRAEYYHALIEFYRRSDAEDVYRGLWHTTKLCFDGEKENSKGLSVEFYKPKNPSRQTDLREHLNAKRKSRSKSPKGKSSGDRKRKFSPLTITKKSDRKVVELDDEIPSKNDLRSQASKLKRTLKQSPIRRTVKQSPERSSRKRSTSRERRRKEEDRKRRDEQRALEREKERIAKAKKELERAEAKRRADLETEVRKRVEEDMRRLEEEKRRFEKEKQMFEAQREAFTKTTLPPAQQPYFFIF